jgi:type I pantothenate kinase
MLDQLTATGLSPYQVFAREKWAGLRADTPLTLTREEILRLQGLNDPISIGEVVDIYLPISRLLAFYVEATQSLHRSTQGFLGTRHGKMPFIIGIAGSVAVGKSTTARLLRELLLRWPSSPKVDLVTTDGFLLPNEVLEQENLMQRKGFPESYDLSALLTFLADIKAGKREVTAPVYSHLVYDVIPGKKITIDRPNILILEGLNVLQPRKLPKDGTAIPFVSDYFDFSIFIDADEDVLRSWYVERFMRLQATRFKDPRSYFHKYADLGLQETEAIANELWSGINLVNLRDNIFPTRPRADLILRKAADHQIEHVSLRKL